MEEIWMETKTLANTNAEWLTFKWQIPSCRLKCRSAIQYIPSCLISPICLLHEPTSGSQSLPMHMWLWASVTCLCSHYFLWFYVNKSFLSLKQGVGKIHVEFDSFGTFSLTMDGSNCLSHSRQSNNSKLAVTDFAWKFMPVETPTSYYTALLSCFYPLKMRTWLTENGNITFLL